MRTSILNSISYQQTIDYLFARLPMFSRIGAAAYKKDLTNTIKLCEFLGSPENKFKSIHIAGTNGKGSVSHMIAAILQTAGYKTGLYTSPHLRDFRERIKVNGEMIEQEFIVDFTEKIKPIIDEIEPSFFEITVAMAFDYFTNCKIDVAVIETGLGGRYDSTNIVTPELSVITNIGWDHMNILGDSLDKIAFEKAGIIKQHVPAILGETSAEIENTFIQVAAEKESELLYSSRIRHAINWRWEKHELTVEVAHEHRIDHQIYRLDLPGLYQTKNLLTVLEVCAQLQQRGWQISEEDIKIGLQNTKKLTGLYGRWDIIHQNPLIILDVAHNEDGVRMLMEQVEVTDHNELHIVMGVVKDKDAERMLSYFPKYAKYYFTQAHIPRAMEAEVLREKASRLNLIGEIFSDVNEALGVVKAISSKNDLVLVCGSVFLVGEVNV